MSGELGPLRTELGLGLAGIWTGQQLAFADLRQFLDDKLAPAPADWVTVRAYLAAVIQRLDVDP